MGYKLCATVPVTGQGSQWLCEFTVENLLCIVTIWEVCIFYSI